MSISPLQPLFFVVFLFFFVYSHRASVSTLISGVIPIVTTFPAALFLEWQTW
jgi:hypothetical protein